MSVVFRFSSETTGDAVSFEIRGTEEFVGRHLGLLLPFVGRATGTRAMSALAAGVEGAPAPVGLEAVGPWWERSVLASTQPSLQDTILLFAFYMRTYRKTVFMSEDIRRCFQVLGIEEPRSLLQILGTLKRDHGLLLSAGRRGEYMMNTTGIARVRGILGDRRAGGAPEPLADMPKAPDARTIFRD